jgi:L-lactate permease
VATNHHINKIGKKKYMEAQIIAALIGLISLVTFLVKSLQKTHENIQNKYDKTLQQIAEQDAKNNEELMLTLIRISGLLRMMMANFNACKQLQKLQEERESNHENK